MGGQTDRPTLQYTAADQCLVNEPTATRNSSCGSLNKMDRVAVLSDEGAEVCFEKEENSLEGGLAISMDGDNSSKSSTGGSENQENEDGHPDIEILTPSHLPSSEETKKTGREKADEKGGGSPQGCLSFP